LLGVGSKKTYSKLGSKMHESASQAPSGFALKQLQKYGWKEYVSLTARGKKYVSRLYAACAEVMVSGNTAPA